MKPPITASQLNARVRRTFRGCREPQIVSPQAETERRRERSQATGVSSSDRISQTRDSGHSISRLAPTALEIMQGVSAFSNLLGIELPIIQAPMAGVQGSALTIAVSNAGGLVATVRDVVARRDAPRTARHHRRDG